jgi:ribose transport system ATP-binding protein
MLAALRHDTIPLHVPVGELTIAEQQVVEIARALLGKPQILIMDEPTSSLTQVDTENLFQLVDRLKEQGVSVIYISHFLEECQRVCDRFTVLRDGETVGGGEMDDLEIDEIVRMMVGREVKDIYPRVERTQGDVLLEARNVRGLEKPTSASFTLRAGEILGVAGLVGAGRTETARAIFGLDKLAAGSVVVHGGESKKRTPGGSLQEGMGLLSENRKEEGLLLNRSLADNITMTRLQSVGRSGFVSDTLQLGAATEWMRKLNVRAGSANQAVGELSGGNQQKIAIARLLFHDADIFLFDEPTRGIDVGSKAEIYALVQELAARGKAVLFISSYLPELFGVCDSISVMCRGELRETRPIAEWTEPEVIRVAVGQSANEAAEQGKTGDTL